MNARRQHPATALSWVREDLDKQLGQMRAQLEHLASVSGVRDEAILEAAGRLDDLRLTLHVLNLTGAAMLADEMTELCRLLGQRHVAKREQGFSALMDAIVILPAYLDRLQAGHHDLPLLLLPVINELRAAHSTTKLQEAALFTPPLDVELPELEAGTTEDADQEPFSEFSQRVRQQYESALLNWLNDQESRDLLSPLQGVCETLLHRLQRKDLKRTWWIASEVLGGLLERRIRNDTHMRRLLARLHLNLKKLSEEGEDAISTASTNALSQALLYRAAITKPGHAGLDLLRKRFRLKELMPDQETLLKAKGSVSGKDRDMYQSLGAAVGDELTLIKDALDLELRTGKVDADRRELCREALLRLRDTLRMLALTTTAETVEALLPDFDASAAAENSEHETALLKLAEDVLMVESEVLEQIDTLGEPVGADDEPMLTELPRHEFRKITQHLLSEIVHSVHQFQDALKSRLDGEREANFTGPIMEVAGALELLGDEKTAALTKRLLQLSERLLGSVYTDSALPPEQLEWLTDAVAALELYLAAVRDQQDQQEHFFRVLQKRLEWLEQGHEAPVQQTIPEPETAANSQAIAEDEPPTVETPSETISSEAVVIDPELLEVFLEEYEDVTETLQQQLPEWHSNLEDVKSLTEVRRCFHTLKGSGRMVGALELGDFCWEIEELLNSLLEARISSFADAALTVRLAQAALPALKQRLMNQPSGLTHEVIEAIGKHAESLANARPADWDELRGELPGFLAGMLPETRRPEAKAEVPVEEDIDVAMRDELQENLRTVETLLDSVSLDRNTLASAEHVRAAHTIAGVLALKPQGQDVEVARALESALETQQDRNTPFNNEALWALGSSFAFLQVRLEQLEGDADAQYPEDEESLLKQLADLKNWFETADPIPAVAVATPSEPPPESKLEEDAGWDSPAVETVPAPSEEPARVEETLQDEITRIFLDEAREVLGRCDSLLNTWRDNLHTMPLVQNLQREIHTLKGGARMAGLEALGDLSHAMEELLERTASHEIRPSIASVTALEQGCDRLNLWVEQISRGQSTEPGEALKIFKQHIEEISSQPDDGSSLPDIELPPVEPKVFTDIPETEAQTTTKAEDTQSQQHIRVDSELLDNLIKSAGEINIFRARMERQIGGLRGNLGEFTETISRLREQFRKLEIETETQIRSRYRDAVSTGDEEFDPLELDRFSSMQQLSRGLSESVADLLNLEELLEESARQADHLLGQQSRVSTELQEGLMQTRMVPFGSIAPRLRRLVRTAATETGKKARLKLLMAGGSDQLDRNVLEHITVPLEHMLRNAIAHGIEAPAERKLASKDPEGEIRITVEAEATEFVIQIEDDGAGINREAIRQRAIERGLIDGSAHPPPQQLFELILGSGFSTSATVTGLAGRGVGMDVVSSEVKQIGGSLEIQSEEGQGSRFTIRIPFTLAVMQAIGVTAGQQRYFIPLTSVAGVARVPPADYQAMLQEDRPTYSFADESYPILELEPLLGEPARALGNDNISLLMIRAGDQRAAFRVPELLGHREVVIKPVGPQITSVSGILGGTVTGDGRVVVILDPGPIIRQALLHGVRPVIPERQVQHKPHRTLAMVVDDSITMRKVNSRVLEGQEIEAITAKDGQDAVEQMQHRVPDILLLDIEMPRMDGYQLAEYVRGDARLRHIPIIMITSRSGQKHRDRATEAGASAYLTKPYKETELIATVYRLLGNTEES